MKFQVGDRVRHGAHVGTVTDVGTVLIQVKTSEGTDRIFCPWELVKTHGANEGSRPNGVAAGLLPCSVR